MKNLTRALLIVAGLLSFGSTLATANTYTLEASFTDSYSGSANNVGSGFFTYQSSSALSDGNYLLSSFTSPTANFIFSSANARFSLADLMSSPSNTVIGIDISGNQFNFTTIGPGNDISGGSADFLNSNLYRLSFSPNGPGENYLGNIHAAYFMHGVLTYDGAYGIGSAAALDSAPTVPEPSTYGLIGIAALGVAFTARRRKVKAV
jgi:PEP-CTERM motif